MSEHTKGPWRAIRNAANKGWLIYGPDPEPQYITLVQEYNHPSIRYEQIKADAHLIAAAPDLLAALKHLSSCPAMIDSPDGKESMSVGQFVNEFIAKAENRATIQSAGGGK